MNETDWTPERLRAQGYSASQEETDARILATMRSRDEKWLTGRGIRPQPAAERAAEERAHTETMAAPKRQSCLLRPEAVAAAQTAQDEAAAILRAAGLR